mgnify:CR=1 FL=1
MMKQMERLDKPRDLYIVTGHEGRLIVIRRSEKQWRKRKYRVKPEQLVKVMSTDDKDNLTADKDTADPSLGTPPSPPQPTGHRQSSRASSRKASMGIQHGYRHKVYQVEETCEGTSETARTDERKKKAESETFVTITFTDQESNQPNLMNLQDDEQVPNQDPDPPPHPSTQSHPELDTTPGDHDQ